MLDYSKMCKELYGILERFPLMSMNSRIQPPYGEKGGVYVFYEDDGKGHSKDSKRITYIGRAGRSRQRQLLFRVLEHLTAWQCNISGPIGYALARRGGDDILASCYARGNFGGIRRDDNVTFGNILSLHRRTVEEFWKKTWFRMIPIDDIEAVKFVEKKLIGIVARCCVCSPGETWLGHGWWRSKKKMNQRLWNSNYLKEEVEDEQEFDRVKRSLNAAVELIVV